MERLTEKRQGQWVIPLREDGKRLWALCSDQWPDTRMKYLYGEYAARLAAYEETGLEPDTASKIRDIVLDISGDIDHLRGLVQAEQDGRVIVLPCRVGDTVWAITSPINIAGMSSDNEKLEIFECTVDSITVYKSYTSSPTHFRLYYHGEFVAWYVTAADFGKTVFLTREEAEAALKGGA